MYSDFDKQEKILCEGLPKKSMVGFEGQQKKDIDTPRNLLFSQTKHVNEKSAHPSKDLVCS